MVAGKSVVQSCQTIISAGREDLRNRDATAYVGYVDPPPYWVKIQLHLKMRENGIIKEYKVIDFTNSSRLDLKLPSLTWRLSPPSTGVRWLLVGGVHFRQFLLLNFLEISFVFKLGIPKAEYKGVKCVFRWDNYKSTLLSCIFCSVQLSDQIHNFLWWDLSCWCNRN